VAIMAKGISAFYGQQYLEPEAPNLFLNSDMYRWQRGTAVTVNNDYTADRWVVRGATAIGSLERSVQVSLSTAFPSGIGVKNSAIINATQAGTRIGFAQRIEADSLEEYRGKVLKLSAYVRRTPSLPGCRIQLAHSAGSAKDDYSSAFVSDMSSISYDEPFDTLGSAEFTRISGDVLVTDAMADNGFQAGIKIIRDGEGSNDLTGELVRVTGLMINDSPVLTPYKTAFNQRGQEDLELQRYMYKTYNWDIAPGTGGGSPGYHEGHTNHSEFIVLASQRFAVRMRTTPSMTVYSPDNGASNTVTRYSSGTNHSGGINFVGVGEDGYRALAGATVSLVVGVPYRYHIVADAEIR
jgi:hypothetical protein